MLSFTAYKQHAAFLFVNIHVIFIQTNPLQTVIINCRDMKPNHVISRRVTATGGREHSSRERITTCTEAPIFPGSSTKGIWKSMGQNGQNSSRKPMAWCCEWKDSEGRRQKMEILWNTAYSTNVKNDNYKAVRWENYRCQTEIVQIKVEGIVSDVQW